MKGVTKTASVDSKKRRSGPSGRSLTDAERKERGQTRLVVWLDAEEAAALEKLAATSSRRDVVGRLLLLTVAR